MQLPPVRDWLEAGASTAGAQSWRPALVNPTWWGSYKTSEAHTLASPGFDLYRITVRGPREMGERASALDTAVTALATRSFPTPTSTFSEGEASVLDSETGEAQTDDETKVTEATTSGLWRKREGVFPGS